MSRLLETLRETFWILALAVIVLFAFFVALGALAPGDVLWLTVGVILLAALWVVHGLLERRRSERDPAVVRARERRGLEVLDADIQAIVDAMNAAPGPAAHLVPVAEARAAHDAESAALGGPGEPVAEVREVAAPGPGGPIPIRVFRPAGEGPLPLVAYLHGGGWTLGSLYAFEPLCRALANASGAVIACVDYRLAPEHPFPAAPDDARAAVRWLAANAAALGADPQRLGIAGDSAGGNLATVTARRLRDEGDTRLRFQALIYPVCDSAVSTASYRENAVGFGLTAASMQRFWELYLQGADGTQPDASPLQAELAGLPPAFVLTVRADVLRDEGEAYARALARAGVPVTVSRYDGAVHGFFRWLARSASARRAVAEVGAALRAGLAPAPAAAP